MPQLCPKGQDQAQSRVTDAPASARRCDFGPLFPFPSLPFTRLPEVSFSGRGAFGYSPSELAGFGQGWNWSSGITGLKEAQGQVAEGEAPFLLLTLGLILTFLSNDLI